MTTSQPIDPTEWNPTIVPMEQPYVHFDDDEDDE
jgi:hypothetical protein